MTCHVAIAKPLAPYYQTTVADTNRMLFLVNRLGFREFVRPNFVYIASSVTESEEKKIAFLSESVALRCYGYKSESTRRNLSFFVSGQRHSKITGKTGCQFC